MNKKDMTIKAWRDKIRKNKEIIYGEKKKNIIEVASFQKDDFSKWCELRYDWQRGGISNPKRRKLYFELCKKLNKSINQ